MVLTSTGAAKAVAKAVVKQIQVAVLEPRMILARRHQMILMMIFPSSVLRPRGPRVVRDPSLKGNAKR